MEFKIGDRVKCIQSIDSYNGGPSEGKIYTITSIKDSWLGFICDYKHSTIGSGIQPNWGYKCFVLVQSLKLRKKIKCGN